MGPFGARAGDCGGGVHSEAGCSGCGEEIQQRAAGREADEDRGDRDEPELGPSSSGPKQRSDDDRGRARTDDVGTSVSVVGHGQCFRVVVGWSVDEWVGGTGR